MSSNGGGPWGGGGDNDNDKSPWGNGGGNNGGGGPNRGGGGGGGNRPPDIEDILKEGRERLKVIVGGGGGGRKNGASGGGGMGKGGWLLAGLAAVLFYGYNAAYTVKPEERSVVLTFGERSGVGEPGLNFILWPIQSAEILPVTRENIIDIGVNSSAQRTGRIADQGLMLTGDENIVDIDFQVVWNIRDPEKYLFNLAQPPETIRAVSESAMREVIGRSALKPILNRDREAVSAEVQELIQATLESYESGVNVVRVNFDKADPPQEVIDAFRDVQAAEQERDTLEKQADAYANQTLAGARGEAAQMLQEAEGYRAKLVNGAQGEASRFKAVYEEYAKAPEVTRKRLYLETMERVLGDVDKVIIDDNAGGGQGVVPYLPLNELRKGGN
ncbi:MAG: FtsH protease activity modulator HflK [Pikeienuella sp.]